MAGIARTFDALKEAVIKEQVIKTCRKELVIFLVEREYESLEQLGQVADRFEEAHSRVGATERKDWTHKGLMVGRETTMEKLALTNITDAKKTTGGTINDVPPRKIVCYTCNKPGHISRDCRQQPKPLSVGTVTYEGVDDCPKYNDVNTAPAIVNGLQGRVLYDTGCKYLVLVAARHVTPSDITQDTVLVRYANSCEECLPIPWVDIEIPYVKGRVKAACVAALACNLVLGCRYVLPQPNPATLYRATVAAVETRAQTQNQ